MAENNFFKLLEHSFPKTDKEVWKKTATKELNGSEPFIQLQWKDNDALEFYPYYDQEDIKNLQFHNNFNLPPAIDSFLGSRTWYNLPHVAVTNAVTSNKIILEHLSSGADGVLLDFSHVPACDLNTLLASIQWEYCSLSFKGVDESFIKILSAYLGSASINVKKISGAVFWDTVPQTRMVEELRQLQPLKSIGYYVPTLTTVNEIHDALVFGVSILESTTNPESVINNIAFSLDTDTRFLNQICKIKALRMLWYQVSQMFNISAFQPHDLHIHSRAETWINKKYQPHGNMLKGIASAMSAVSGGCNSLTIFPEDEDNAMMRRIARNISSILREESNFDKVSDPSAGSYAIEVMTDKLAQEAWTKFQKTMSSR
jgi:methylmalonyl-CoA mutase